MRRRCGRGDIGSVRSSCSRWSRFGRRGWRPGPGAVSPGSRPAFARCRFGAVRWQVVAVRSGQSRCGVGAAARSTGWFPRSVSRPCGGAVCRGPGSAARFRGPAPGLSFRPSVCGANAPSVRRSLLTQRSSSHQVPWPVRQLKSPRYRGLSIFCVSIDLSSSGPAVQWAGGFGRIKAGRRRTLEHYGDSLQFGGV